MPTGPMNKLTVETTGAFMLLDRFSGREIPAEGSVTVPETPFITERLENGDLRLIDGEPQSPTEETEAAAAEAAAAEAAAAEAKAAEEAAAAEAAAAEAKAAEEAAAAEAKATEEAAAAAAAAAAETKDADADGHDDKTGEFVEGNQEAAKPGKKGKGK